MNMQSAAVLLISAMLATSAMAAVTTTVVDVPTPADGTQRFLYLRPDAATANIVYLPGGSGALGIQNDGTMTTYEGGCSPVARDRQAFADHGYSVALVDATSNGSVYDFNDVLQVILYVQARDNVPSWIIGISSSTTPITNLAVNLPSEMSVGVVFLSPDSPNAARVAQIKRPTLVVYQPLDDSQFAGPLFADLTSAPVKQLISLSGGNNNGCGYHLFNNLDAEFVAAVSGFIDTYNGATGGGSSQTADAVEYYYSAWNFYFMTSFTSEINALDGGAFGGAWQRTGQTFKVWPQTNPSAVEVCRFFSTAIFAPKSSHVYTPFASECDFIKTNPADVAAWQFENIAFYIQLADANGMCGAGTIPLYRAFNQGMGGAPNHRYMTSLTILNQMIAAGWTFEGNGNTMVFACVPA